MRSSRHDPCSKDLLSIALSPLGHADIDRHVQGEARRIDVLFTERASGPKPRDHRQRIGVLSNVARGIAPVEVFRNPCTRDELRGCVVKVIEMRDDLCRRARRAKRPTSTVALPRMWVFAELIRLPPDDPLVRETMQSMLQWHIIARTRDDLTEEEAELLMNSEQIYLEWERRTRAQAHAEGRSEGEAKGKVDAILSVLRARQLDVTPEQATRITQCRDLATIDRWLSRVATATSTDAIFASVPRTKAQRQPLARPG